MCPPMGILNLKFYGSFIKSINRGGNGGVIRQWSDNIIWSFSGPVECPNASEAEVFALLIGCCKLHHLDELMQLLKVILSWRFNWCYERRLLFLGYRRILDTLVKDGVFLTSMIFFVSSLFVFYLLYLSCFFFFFFFFGAIKFYCYKKLYGLYI